MKSFNLIIKNNNNKFFLGTSWSSDKGEYADWVDNKNDAQHYTSPIAFDNADKFGCKVFLRTKVRGIEVTREDFGYE